MGTSKFETTMSAFGYVLDEQDGKKLTYRKRMQFSELVLVFDLESRYVNPILVPSSILLYERDLLVMFAEFKKLREDAQILADMANYKLLN